MTDVNQPNEDVQNPDAVTRAQANPDTAPTQLDGQPAPDSATNTIGAPSGQEPDDDTDTDAGQPA